MASGADLMRQGMIVSVKKDAPAGQYSLSEKLEHPGEYARPAISGLVPIGVGVEANVNGKKVVAYKNIITTAQYSKCPLVRTNRLLNFPKFFLEAYQCYLSKDTCSPAINKLMLCVSEYDLRNKERKFAHASFVSTTGKPVEYDCGSENSRSISYFKEGEWYDCTAAIHGEQGTINVVFRVDEMKEIKLKDKKGKTLRIAKVTYNAKQA